MKQRVSATASFGNILDVLDRGTGSVVRLTSARVTTFPDSRKHSARRHVLRSFEGFGEHHLLQLLRF